MTDERREERVGGSGPGPLKDETNEPELGINPYASADSAGGGYGSRSGRSSGGTGDGEAGAPLHGSSMDDGTTSGATGASDAGPTDWVRGAGGSGSDAEGEGRANADDAEARTAQAISEDAAGIAEQPVGNDNIREGRVGGVMGVGHPSAGQGQGG